LSSVIARVVSRPSPGNCLLPAHTGLRQRVHHLGDAGRKLPPLLGELLGRHPEGVYMTNDKFSMTISQLFQSLKSSPRHNCNQESHMRPKTGCARQPPSPASSRRLTGPPPLAPPPRVCPGKVSNVGPPLRPPDIPPRSNLRRPYFGNNAAKSSCGRAITCAATSLPRLPTAREPASTAALTAATSPRTMTVT